MGQHQSKDRPHSEAHIDTKSWRRQNTLRRNSDCNTAVGVERRRSLEERNDYVQASARALLALGLPAGCATTADVDRAKASLASRSG